MSGRVLAWRALTSPAFAGLDPATTVAVLPVGAVEQHGPHLPTGTDGLILEAVLAGLRERPPARATALLLPLQEVGDSLEHARYPGSLTVPAEALIAAWTALGAGVAAAGLKKLLILNSHGGQPQIVDLVAKRLRSERAMIVVRANTFRMGTPEGLFSAEELRWGYHAGAVETALLRAIAPELVVEAEVADFPNRGRGIAEASAVIGKGGASYSWESQDLNPAGATGDARQGGVEAGRALLAHLVGQVAALLDDMAALPADLPSGSP